MRYFTIGDSYSYNLTRVKEAFAIGTVSLDDFVEFDEEFIDDIVEYLIKYGVTIVEVNKMENNNEKYKE